MSLLTYVPRGLYSSSPVYVEDGIKEAAEMLGMTVETVGSLWEDGADFLGGVRSGSPPDIIVFSGGVGDLGYGDLDLEAEVVTAIDEQVCAGRYAISSYGRTDESSEMLDALGVTWRRSYREYAEPDVYPMAGFASSPFMLPDVFESTGDAGSFDAGDIWEPDSVTVLATADAAGTEPIVVMGRGGRTIANGLLFANFTGYTDTDTDGDLVDDFTELMVNQFAQFCDPGDVSEPVPGDVQLLRFKRAVRLRYVLCR